MSHLLDPLNNREIAVYLWTVVGSLAVLLIPGCRRSLRSMLSIVVSPKVLLPFLLMFGYTAGCVVALQKLHLWDPSLLRDTVLWACSAGVLMLFNALSQRGNERFFKDTATDAVMLIVVVEFIANVYVFPLAVELIAVPLIVFLSMMKAVAELDPKNRPADVLLGWILALYGLSALAISGVRVVANFSDALTLEAARGFLLPILLTILLIPFAYFFALVSAYELAFLGLKRTIEDPVLRRYAKFKLLLRFHLNLGGVRNWTSSGNPFTVSTREEVRRMIREVPLIWSDRA